MFLHQSFVKGLGHASYLVGDTAAGVAAVVDPRRDVDEYLELAASEGLTITDVFETHVHNDYVSGADEVRRQAGARVHIGTGAGLTRVHQPTADGDVHWLGALRIRTIATPGHTPDHVSFAVADTSRSEDDWVLFAGGALLVGTAARPDLLGGPDEARRAAAIEFATLRDRIATLPDWLEVYPTHGAGSLCGSGIGGKRWTTVGYERRNNPALQQPDGEAFTAFILRDQPSVPAYWRRMRQLNQTGAALLDDLPAPTPLDPAAVLHASGHGAVVIDARPGEAYIAGHLPGALGIGLEPMFGTWVGSVVPVGSEIVLVLDRDEDLSEALAQLHRASYDRVAGYLAGGFPAWLAAGFDVETLPTIEARDVAARLAAGTLHVLDVREASEWRGGHVPGAVHIPAGQLPTRIDEVPRGPLAVVCAAGYRSIVAASFLRRAGFDEAANLPGGTSAYAAAGLPLMTDLEPLTLTRSAR